MNPRSADAAGSPGHATRSGAGALLAVLCNPPLKPAETTTSWHNVGSLAAILRAGTVSIENLIQLPTRSTCDLIEAVSTVDVDAVRRRIERAARAADIVVAGWGTRQPKDWPRAAWRDLLSAAVDGLHAAGHESVLHVGPGARHPSRWRQHTSPIHERYVGETFELRLHDALRWTPLAELTL